MYNTRNVIALPATSQGVVGSATPGPRRPRSLCEVPGFLAAVSVVRELHPLIPRSALVRAGLAVSPRFNDLPFVDVETVIRWASQPSHFAGDVA